MVEPGREAKRTCCADAAALPLGRTSHSRVVTGELDGASRVRAGRPGRAGSSRTSDSATPKIPGWRSAMSTAPNAPAESPGNRAIGLSSSLTSWRDSAQGTTSRTRYVSHRPAPFLVAALARHPARDRHHRDERLTRWDEINSSAT